MSSAMLPNVALRMPPDLRPRERPEALGADAHDVGEAQDAGRADDEDGSAVDAQQPLHGDGHDAHRERGHERHPTSGRQIAEDREGVHQQIRPLRQGRAR